MLVVQNQPLSNLEGKRPLQWVAEHTMQYSGADLLELATLAVRHSAVQTTGKSARDILRWVTPVIVTAEAK